MNDDLPSLPNFRAVGSLMAAFRWAPSTEKAVEYRNKIINAILEEAAQLCEVGIAESDPGGYNNACRACAAVIRARIVK